MHLLRWLWTAFCARWWPPVLYIKRAPKFVLGFPPTPIWIKHYIDKLDVVLGLRLVGRTKQRQQDNKANTQLKKNVARGIFEQRCTLAIVSLSVGEYRIEVLEQFESRHQPPIEVRVQQCPKPRFLPHSTTSKDSGKVALRA